jgi:hypothetical protein
MHSHRHIGCAAATIKHRYHAETGINLISVPTVNKEHAWSHACALNNFLGLQHSRKERALSLQSDCNAASQIILVAHEDSILVKLV